MKKLINLTFIGIFLLLITACTEVSTTTDSTTLNTTTEISQTVSSTETTSQSTTLSTSTTTETSTVLQEIDLIFDGHIGDGTMESPYVINLMINDSFTKTINFKALSSHLIYEEGIFLSGEFHPIQDEEFIGLNLDGSTDFSISVKALKIGVFYIRISSPTISPNYVRVNVEEYSIDFSKNLKVLAIGNSFSVDAMEYLYKIADDYQIPNIILGIMYIPGASLEKHVDSITNNLHDYVYYKNSNNAWVYADSSASLLDGLLDEDWDIITIQQVSGYSGIASTYNEDIDTIIEYVNQNKTNELAEIAWHMTWAYQEGSTHPDFVRYSSDQLTMYQAIMTTVQNEILSRDDISYVIPSGTAIQNLRTSFIGDTLTRDGYHLSLEEGRYTASLTWFHMITGFPIDGIMYKPTGIDEFELAAIKEAVVNAVINPYQITQSSYDD